MNKYNWILSTALLLVFGNTYSSDSLAANGMEGRDIFVGEPTEEQCRNCHEDSVRFPQLDMINPDLHHVLNGTPIPEPELSKAPAAPGGIPGEPYQCISCHEFIWDTVQMMYVIKSFRDCLQCHPVSVVTGSPGADTNVHHKTETFDLRECSDCHRDEVAQQGQRRGNGG